MINTPHQGGKSTETVLRGLVIWIGKPLYNKKCCLVAFLDIEGVLKNIRLDVGTPLRHFFHQLLLSRIITRTWKAITQISRFLWKIAYKGKEFKQTLCDLIQGTLRELSSCSTQFGICVNSNKIELLLFTRRCKIPAINTPVLHGVQLRLSIKAKFLEVIWDKKLKWKDNIIPRYVKAAIDIYTRRRAIGKRWGRSLRSVPDPLTGGKNCNLSVNLSENQPLNRIWSKSKDK